VPGKKAAPPQPIEEDTYDAVPTPRKAAFHFSENDEIYAGDESQVKTGFHVDDDDGEAAPPPPPKAMPTAIESAVENYDTVPLPRPAAFHFSGDDGDNLYETGEDVARAGFRTDNAPAPAPEPRKPPPPPPVRKEPATQAPVGMVFSGDDEVYEGVDDFAHRKEGFSAHDKGARSEELQEIYEAFTDGELPAPPVSAAQGLPTPPPKAPLSMVFSGDEELYEGVDDVAARKDGFSAHDKGMRSDELQEIYEAATDGALPPPPIGAAVPRPPADDVYEEMPAPSSRRPPPPVTPKRAEVPSVLPMAFSESETYEAVPEAGATREGFAVHDRSERSDELQDIYEEVKEGPLPPPPVASPPVRPPPASTATPLAFQASEEGVYASNETREGFVSDKEEIYGGDLAAAAAGGSDTGAQADQGDVYEAMLPPGQAAPKRPPKRGPVKTPAPIAQRQSVWMHGGLTRSEAEVLLAGKPMGAFLVRSKGNVYALSLVRQHAPGGGIFEHHQLSTGASGLYLVNGTPLTTACSSVEAVVEFLKTTAENISTRLTEAVPA
jgi:hypothetical protein